MAGWMVHLRVADGILDLLQDIHEEAYIAGTIAPDSGELTAEGYDPPRYKSHWTDNAVMHWSTHRAFLDIHYDSFFETYVQTEPSKTRWSFYLGYYVHLLTDALWIEEVMIPTRVNFDDDYKKDKWKVRADWSDLEHLFFRENPDFRSFRILERVDSFPNVYLDYFSEEAIEKRLKSAVAYYRYHTGNLDREYPYLSQAQADAFVEKAVQCLRQDLTTRGII